MNARQRGVVIDAAASDGVAGARAGLLEQGRGGGRRDQFSNLWEWCFATALLPDGSLILFRAHIGEGRAETSSR
jgi:hypothetical protein